MPSQHFVWVVDSSTVSTRGTARIRMSLQFLPRCAPHYRYRVNKHRYSLVPHLHIIVVLNSAVSPRYWSIICFYACNQVREFAHRTQPIATAPHSLLEAARVTAHGLTVGIEASGAHTASFYFSLQSCLTLVQNHQLLPKTDFLLCSLHNPSNTCIAFSSSTQKLITRLDHVDNYQHGFRFQ